MMINDRVKFEGVKGTHCKPCRCEKIIGKTVEEDGHIIVHILPPRKWDHAPLCPATY